MTLINKKDDFPFEVYLKNLYNTFANVTEGEVATYIPELAKANPKHFGISLVTVDGTVQSIGDTSIDFTIQSISKPFVYGLVLQDLGVASVLEKINAEPSGDAFNSISLEPQTGRPLNPMINAGAIATTSCVQGADLNERRKRILATLSNYAGKKLAIDSTVYKSEQRTGHRNHAIAHMLRNFNIIENNLDAALNLYFQQCSILANCNDLATMAATLANDGINPITGVRAIHRDFVPLVLSVMSLCGMYDYSGRWIYDVGLPAKSGVGGGIIAVLPGQFGLCVYSPRLDERGNSVRGTRVCKQFSQDFGLHILQVPKIASSIIRSNYSIKQFRSTHLRSSDDSAVLDRWGDKAKVFELQGEMRFATAEKVVRLIFPASFQAEFILIDFKRVSYLDAGACKLLETLTQQLQKKEQCHLIISGLAKSLLIAFPQLFKEKTIRHFDELDLALEWIENILIKSHTPHRVTISVPFAENEMCQGLSANQVTLLTKHTETRRYKKDELIVKSGETADTLFFLIRGEVRINLYNKNQSKNKARVATFPAGMCFGELSLIEKATRTANVVANGNVECRVLHVTTFNQLCESDLGLKVHFLVNLAKKLAKNLQQSNLKVLTLTGESQE